ncbi:hypothetical protein N0V85_006193 [Neurospora sp. IMI 360204]|nr:hypothetical protein N0V85_006193 [Neurospora sp. IMI 360204]
MQTPYGGPAVPVPPLGYESYSFQNYPSTHKTNGAEYYSTTAANDVFGQAVPSLRTTPKYHPTNEMTPEETQRYHNDRRLFVKMKAAWVDNDKVLRLREQKGDENALQTLWEVAQVFRARNPVNPSAESVKWFVDQRDRILRPNPRGQQRQSAAHADEESGHDNLEDLVNAAAAAEELEVVEPAEPMDVDEPEQQQQEDEEQMPQQAENDEEDDDDDDDDDDEYIDVDELAPAFRMLQKLEQQQQQQQPAAASVSPPSIHSQDYDADVDNPETQSEIADEQEKRHDERARSSERAAEQRAQSKGNGRLGINDLLN